MADVIDFRPKIRKGSPQDVLESSKDAFQSVIIAGWSSDGVFEARISDDLSLSEAHWLASLLADRILRVSGMPLEEM